MKDAKDVLEQIKEKKGRSYERLRMLVVDIGKRFPDIRIQLTDRINGHPASVFLNLESGEDWIIVTAKVHPHECYEIFDGNLRYEDLRDYETFRFIGLRFSLKQYGQFI